MKGTFILNLALDATRFFGKCADGPHGFDTNEEINERVSFCLEIKKKGATLSKVVIVCDLQKALILVVKIDFSLSFKS